MTRRKPKPAPESPAAEPVPEAPTATPPAPTDAATPATPVSEPPSDAAGTAGPTPGRPPLPNPFGIKQDVLAGVRLLEDRRFRQMQIRFAEKPPEHVRQAVSEAGFRWLSDEQVWAKQIDREKGWQTRALAEEVFERVAAMVREAKGVSREHG